MLFVRNGKDDASVWLLEDIGMLMFKQTGYYNVAAFHQTQCVLMWLLSDVIQKRDGPGAGGIDDGPCTNLLLSSLSVFQFSQPMCAVTARSHAAGAGEDTCATLCCIHCIQHDQPCVLDLGVAIHEAGVQLLFEWLPSGMLGQVQAT